MSVMNPWRLSSFILSMEHASLMSSTKLPSWISRMSSVLPYRFMHLNFVSLQEQKTLWVEKVFKIKPNLASYRMASIWRKNCSREENSCNLVLVLQNFLLKPRDVSFQLQFSQLTKMELNKKVCKKEGFICTILKHFSLYFCVTLFFCCC